MKWERVISEAEFAAKIQELLTEAPDDVAWVTGPGRSGAIAAVYASHLLGIPFVPQGRTAPGRALLVDTARQTGKTLRKAARRIQAHDPFVWFGFEEPPRVYFWYEAQKPQRYRHENR